MAITITHPLLPIHFSRNAAEIEFEALDKFDTMGVQKQQKLRFSSSWPDTDGDTLLVEWSRGGINYSFTITFKTTPDPDAYEVETYDTPTHGWLIKFMNAMLANPDFAEQYAVSVLDVGGEQGLTVTTRSQDDEGISITPTGFTAIMIQNNTGAAPVVKTDYRLSAWLYIGADADTPVGEMYRTREIELDTDPSGKVKLNLQRYLTDYLHQPEPPTDTTGSAVRCTVIDRPAFILFGQKWNAPYERQKQFATPIFRVFKGGLEQAQFAAARADIKNYLRGRFFTLRPTRTISYSGQRDWLTYYSAGAEEIHFKAFRTDGSTSQTTLYSQTQEAGIYQLRADLDAVLPTYPPGLAPIYKYQLRIYSTTQQDYATPPVTFIIDEDYLDLTFEFENSLGATEAWKMTGEHSAVANIAKEGYHTRLPFNAPAHTRTLKTNAERVTKALNCTTGPLTASEAKAFADFLRSRHTYLRTGSDRIPVRISGGEITEAQKTLTANHARTGKFTAELSLSPNVS